MARGSLRTTLRGITELAVTEHARTHTCTEGTQHAHSHLGVVWSVCALLSCERSPVPLLCLWRPCRLGSLCSEGNSVLPALPAADPVQGEGALDRHHPLHLPGVLPGRLGWGPRAGVRGLGVAWGAGSTCLAPLCLLPDPPVWNHVFRLS